MDWRYISSSRMPALEIQSPKFKPQFHQEKKERKSSSDVRMVYNMHNSICLCDTTHKQNQRQKPHHLYKCRKSLHQNFMIKVLRLYLTNP
jgi:hypothetical protein